MFENFRVFETEFAGRKMTFETGKMCCQAGGSVLVRYGETTVLVNATASAKPRDGIDFLPLSVDFEEKLYAVGKIPGSFLKREGRPSDKAVLSSRVVDRPIRPLFPKDMRNDVSVVMTVLSVDPDCVPEIAGMIGASMALSISDIPWNGPIAGINVGLVDGEIILTPNAEQRQKSDLQLTVAGTAEKVCMIEAGANEVDDDTMLEAIMKGFAEVQKMVAFIKEVQAEIGKPKFTFESQEIDHDLFEAIKDEFIEDVRAAMDTDDKNIRDERMRPIYDRLHAEYDEKYPEQGAMLDECIYKLQKFVVRRWLLDDGKRVDGRGMDEIRPLDAEVGIIPRVHGSGMFTRGQTQVLTIATLGTIREAQILDGIDEQTSKRYIHQYNMPSYSVGETRPSRGPGRREIGHGALAERALEPVIPSVEEFPYTMRLVSEVLSSNGSTMVDIQGVEDFFGDMDFKVGGTKKGITAIQMDLKIDGLTPEIIKEAFAKTHKARNYILDEVMLKAIPAPRPELSKYAPKMLSMTIDPDKIREVIGSGGKTIQKICAECNVKIDIEDDGHVFVSAIDIDDCRTAINIIETIVNDPEVGAIYKGVVTRLMNFGAFVEIAPGKEGLVHISKLDAKRVEKVEDVVSVGDEILVMVTEIDQQGRINLSRKDAIAKMEAKKEGKE